MTGEQPLPQSGLLKIVVRVHQPVRNILHTQMLLEIKRQAIRLREKIAALCSGMKGILSPHSEHQFSFPIQPILLYRQPPDHVLLLHQGEPIDLLGSIQSTIKLNSGEGHSVTFRHEGAFLVIQSEGLEMESIL